MLPHTVCILSRTAQVGFLFHPGFHKTHIHNARPGGGGRRDAPMPSLGTTQGEPCSPPQLEPAHPHQHTAEVQEFMVSCMRSRKKMGTPPTYPATPQKRKRTASTAATAIVR